jgi:hypothetical protein
MELYNFTSKNIVNVIYKHSLSPVSGGFKLTTPTVDTETEEGLIPVYRKTLEMAPAGSAAVGGIASITGTLRVLGNLVLNASDTVNDKVNITIGSAGKLALEPGALLQVVGVAGTNSNTSTVTFGTDLTLGEPSLTDESTGTRTFRAVDGAVIFGGNAITGSSPAAKLLLTDLADVEPGDTGVINVGSTTVPLTLSSVDLVFDDAGVTGGFLKLVASGGTLSLDSNNGKPGQITFAYDASGTGVALTKADRDTVTSFLGAAPPTGSDAVIITDGEAGGTLFSISAGRDSNSRIVAATATILLAGVGLTATSQ